MTQNIIWDKAYSSGRDYLILQSQQIEVFLNFIKKPYGSKTILELGCGTGNLTRKLNEYNFSEIVGVDSSMVALGIAESLNTSNNISYISLDLEDTFSKIINKKFDVVICKDTLAFISDKDAFFQQVKKCINNSGIFIIISPLRSITPPNKIHITLDADKTKEQLSRFFNLDSYYYDSLEEYYICSK